MKPLRLFLCLLFASGTFASLAQTGNFAAVDNFFTTNASRYNNDLVCLVKVNGRPVYYKTLGAQRDSLRGYLIASATKTFTAAVMLRLAQEGAINLDVPISTYLPQATMYGKGVCTIRQNFSHTAGWSGTTGENYLTNPRITLAQSVDSILRFDPWAYQPGTHFKYTGVSMQVGGYCAVVATNTPWSTLFATRIKGPLGLDSTSYKLTSPNNPRLAGGIRSTARDVLRFAEFIRRNGKNASRVQVVDSVWMQELWRDQTNHAPVIAAPYPAHPTYNNPYNADTIRYGFGAWQDVYNPTTRYQEQISGDGATGVVFWVDRCRGISAAIMTTAGYAGTATTTMHAIDLVRTAVGGSGGCGRVLATATVAATTTAAATVYPNPTHDRLFLNVPSGQPVEVQVYTLTGQLVAAPAMLRSNEWLNTTGWPAGFYYVRVAVAGAPPSFYKVYVQL